MSQDTSKQMNAALRAVTGRKRETGSTSPKAKSREHYWKVVDGVAFKVRPTEDGGRNDRPSASANAGAGTGTEYPGKKRDMNYFIRLAAGKAF